MVNKAEEIAELRPTSHRQKMLKIFNYLGEIFDYIDQALTVLSATSGVVSIISFTSIIGAPVGIASSGLTLFF